MSKEECHCDCENKYSKLKPKQKDRKFGMYFLIGFLGIPCLPMTLMFATALLYLHPITHLGDQAYLDKYEPSLSILLLMMSVFIWIGVPILIQLYGMDKPKIRSPIT